MTTNDPIIYAEREARADKRDPISPTNGQSNLVTVRIAEDDEVSWHVAFPGLVEDLEREYRS